MLLPVARCATSPRLRGSGERVALIDAIVQIAPRSKSRLAPSAELAGPGPVNPFSDYDLRMLAIANIAAEDTGAALPAHRIASAPGRAYLGWHRSRAQLVALAGLTRFASR
jgi:hypothetical protein